MGDSQTKDTVWTKINVLAAVLASLVAMAGLVYTVRAGRASGDSSSSAAAGSTSTAVSSSDAGTAGAATTSAPARSGQNALLPLTDLTLAAGAGNVTRNGTTLTMSCGTNQSDDTFREIQYALPTTRHYPHFQAALRGGQGGGADQEFTVSAFARGQYVRADQWLQIATATFRPGGGAQLHGDLADGVDTLVLRLVCHLPGASVTINSAGITS